MYSGPVAGCETGWKWTNWEGDSSTGRTGFDGLRAEKARYRADHVARMAGSVLFVKHAL